MDGTRWIGLVMDSEISILCLDLFTSCGWALRDRHGCVYHGAQSFQPRRFDGGGMRFVRFAVWLEELRSFGVDICYYEEVRRHKGVDAAHIYGGFQAQLTAWCEQQKTAVAYEGVPPGTWKKACGLKGNCSKKDVLAWARQQGYLVESYDEADALGILEWAKQRHKVMEGKIANVVSQSGFAQDDSPVP